MPATKRKAKIQFLRLAGYTLLVSIVGIGTLIYKLMQARYDEQIASQIYPMERIPAEDPSKYPVRPVQPEYRPGGEAFLKDWNRFYNGDHEPELDDPLIEAGAKMVPAICEAIANRDMKLRRYAISALGFIGDKRAIPLLETILNDKTEEDYFRGDALHALYLIDETQGAIYAAQHKNENKYLNLIGSAIEKKEAWLKAPTEE